MWIEGDKFCNVDISILTISQSRKFTTLNANSATSAKIAKFFQVRCQLNGIIFYAIVHTKIKTTLSQVDSDGDIDETVTVLSTEVESLQRILIAIAECCRLPVFMSSSQNGDEQAHWNNLQQSLNDCKGTLETLE